MVLHYVCTCKTAHVWLVALFTHNLYRYTALANEHGAVNLGQGFPSFPPPSFVTEAAIEALRDGHHQYTRHVNS
jgi:aspartate/methionine/tyrosine aminotransferase